MKALHRLSRKIDTEEARQLLCRHSILNLSPISYSILVNINYDFHAYDSPSSMHTIVNNPASDEGRLQEGISASEFKTCSTLEMAARSIRALMKLKIRALLPCEKCRC
eukprot:IDg15785t1